jgi:hypothetical protein
MLYSNREIILYRVLNTQTMLVSLMALYDWKVQAIYVRKTPKTQKSIKNFGQYLVCCSPFGQTTS